MQIIPNYDFTTGGPFTPGQMASFTQDVQTAINIYNATFTNDITLTLDVGFGSIGTQTFDSNGVPSITRRKMTPTEGGLGAPNAVVLVTYSDLRTALRNNGQPGFFNAANLPAGDSINNMSNFWVTSSQAKALGLPLQNPGLVDGIIGINITSDKGGFTPGPERIAAILHEFGHAMGRVQDNLDSDRKQTGSIGPGIYASELDLVRFISPGDRLFDGNLMAPLPAEFSLDGGATTVADWAIGSAADFRSSTRAGNSLTPNDPFNDVGGATLAKLTTADIQLMEALGFRVGPTAVMILRRASDGLYEIYSLGGNKISTSSQFGQVGTDWQFVTLGGFDDDFTSEMLLRDSTSGGFEVYDITHDELTGVAFMGDVGLDWQFFGVGNFSSKPGETDIMLRNTGTGQDSGKFLIYNIKNDGVTDTFQSPLTVGLNCQFSGVGNFSSNPGESDIIFRDTNTGKLFLYNINNNQMTFVGEIGTVGSNWQFAGVAPIRVPGASDLVLRNVNTGEFWVYNIANNQIMGNGSLGTVGSEWQLGGFAPTASNGFIGNSGGPLASGPQPSAGSTSQLAQAMAGFGGGSGAADGSNAAPLSADTSQQTLLTTPQHA